MKNQDFDRYVKEESASDIVRHLRSIGLENLAFYVCELIEIKEILEDHTLDHVDDLKEYLENALSQEDLSDLVQDFFEECDIYTDDETDSITRDDMQKCKQTTFTKYLPTKE